MDVQSLYEYKKIGRLLLNWLLLLLFCYFVNVTCMLPKLAMLVFVYNYSLNNAVHSFV